MNDPVEDGARAAANRLTPQHGPRLAADVEAALHTRDATARPDRYLDPVSLAGLIVSIATLAWTIYKDLKKQTNPSAEVITRTIRVELGTTGRLNSAEHDQIIDITVEETLDAARRHDSDPN